MRTDVPPAGQGGVMMSSTGSVGRGGGGGKNGIGVVERAEVASDASSEEYILQGIGIGVTRTVSVRIEDGQEYGMGV